LNAFTMNFDHRVGTMHVQTPLGAGLGLCMLYPLETLLSQLPAKPAKFKVALTRVGLKWRKGISVRGRLCSS
jgi:hypothetical protein